MWGTKPEQFMPSDQGLLCVGRKTFLGEGADDPNFFARKVLVNTLKGVGQQGSNGCWPTGFAPRSSGMSTIDRMTPSAANRGRRGVRLVKEREHPAQERHEPLAPKRDLGPRQSSCQGSVRPVGLETLGREKQQPHRAHDAGRTRGGVLEGEGIGVKLTSVFFVERRPRLAGLE